MYLTFQLEWIINTCIMIKELSGEEDKNTQYRCFFQKIEPTTLKHCLFISPPQFNNGNEGAMCTCWAQDESLTVKAVGGGQRQWRGQEEQQVTRVTGGVPSPSPCPHVSGPLGDFNQGPTSSPAETELLLSSTAV